MMLEYQASDSETTYDSCDFLKAFLIFSIRPTDPISGVAFDAKGKKKKGGGGGSWWPNDTVSVREMIFWLFGNG